MRVYFMRGNKISAVELLKTAPDEELIRRAETLFRDLSSAQGFDGFEVWDGKRFVYRFPADEVSPANRP